MTHDVPHKLLTAAASHLQFSSCCSGVMQPGGSGGAHEIPEPATASG